MNVTVLTATIPSRAVLLAEAQECVRYQTVPAAHLIKIDEMQMGAANALNYLLDLVVTDHLMVLDDDDLLDDNHLATLEPFTGDAEVVYSYCRTEGRDFVQYNQPFERTALQRRSVVSHTAVVRTEAVRAAGGWRRVPGYDWDLWRRLAALGARFTSVPEVTWTYRLNADWKHLSWDGESDAPQVVSWN